VKRKGIDAAIKEHFPLSICSPNTSVWLPPLPPSSDYLRLVMDAIK